MRYIFPPPANYIRESKTLYTKAIITYIRPTTIGQKLISCMHLAKQVIKHIESGVRTLYNFCTLQLPWKAQPIHMVSCVSQIMTKYETLPLNRNLTCANYGIYVAPWVTYHEQHVSQTTKNFPRDGHCSTTVTGTNLIVKMTKTELPYCSTIQCSIASQINHLYMKLTLIFCRTNLFSPFGDLKMNGIHTWPAN